MSDIQNVLERAFETTKNGEGITREQMDEFKKLVEPQTTRMIQDETLEFVKTNMNHLPMYYIPQKEFEWVLYNLWDFDLILILLTNSWFYKKL